MKVKAASRTVRSIMLSFATVVLSCVFGMSAVAAESGGCTVNDVELNQGDIFTYTLNITEPEDKISEINVSIFYDPYCLKIIPDKISIPVFTSARCSYEFDGEIRFNAVNTTNGYDLTQGGTAIEVPFEILDGVKDTNITFTISEIYGLENDTSLTDYDTNVTIELGEPDKVVNPPNIAELESEVSQQESLREQRSSNEFLTWTVICVVIGVIALAVVAVLLLKLNKRRQFLS